MPTQSGPAGAGDDTARKLLDGADPASLASDEMLAGIEALAGQKTVEAANALVRLEQEGLIQVQGRSVKLLDLSALKQLLGQRC